MRATITLIATLLIATAAHAIDVVLCEYPAFPAYCETQPAEIHMGDVLGGHGVQFRPYVKIGEGETWTDNTCSIRLTGSMVAASGGGRFTMGHSWVPSGWNQAHAANEEVYSHALWTTNHVDHPLAYGEASEFAQVINGRKLHITPHAVGLDCDPPREVQFVVDAEQSGAAHSLIGDPPIWFCGLLPGGNPPSGIAEGDVLGVNLDIRPINVITEISMTLIPDADGDGEPNSTDNCGEFANPEQVDSNGDGFGNFCDADYNNDGVVDPVDFIIFSQHWSRTCAHPFFDPDIDQEYGTTRPGNCVIGPSDFVMLSATWGSMSGTVCE